MKKSTTPPPEEPDVGQFSQDDTNDQKPVKDEAVGLDGESWKTFEELLHALPYSDIIAAVAHFNKIDEDTPYHLWYDANESLGTLKKLAQLGNIEAIANLVTIGNDIASFLADQVGSSLVIIPNPFPNDSSIFQDNDGGASCEAAGHGELEYQKICTTRQQLEVLILTKILGDDEAFDAYFNPAWKIHQKTTCLGGLSLESLTNDTCFRDINEIKEESELPRKLYLVEELAARIVSERIGSFARRALIYTAEKSDTWPVAASHLREIRSKQIERLVDALKLGARLPIRHAPRQKRGRPRGLEASQPTGFVHDWIARINSFRADNEDVLNFTLGTCYCDLKSESNPCPAKATIASAPDLSDEQVASDEPLSLEEQATLEELVAAFTKWFKKSRSEPSASSIRQMEQSKVQAAWVEKCKALPNLSKDESVIKQWKELILEGLRLEHPGDWKDVQWPKSIQNRIDAIPAGVFSVQRHRTPEEAVREAIESGLEQLSREI